MDGKTTSMDLDATVKWVGGAVTDPLPTAHAYRETRAPWLRTFLIITLPVYAGAAVVGFVLSWLFGRPYMFGAAAAAPLLFLFSLAWSLAFVFVAVFIFDYLAGTFGGERNYDAMFAALSLAMVPGALGGALSPLPWVGWLIGFAAGIYSLVLAYQFIPIFVTLPQDKRVLHFIVSLVVAAIVNFVVAAVFGLMYGASMPDGAMSGSGDVADEAPGWLGGMERGANYADQAMQDTYEPPADGRLTDDQVATYVRNLERTAALRERLGAKLEGLGDEERETSFTDVFSGVNDAVRLGTAEMEVVKTGGGNWKEHQWVKEQLEIARIQQDGSAAIEHNYELFQEYEEEIEQYE